jgi:hypothetical protein
VFEHRVVLNAGRYYMFSFLVLHSTAAFIAQLSASVPPPVKYISPATRLLPLQPDYGIFKGALCAASKRIYRGRITEIPCQVRHHRIQSAPGQRRCRGVIRINSSLHGNSPYIIIINPIFYYEIRLAKYPLACVANFDYIQ